MTGYRMVVENDQYITVHLDEPLEVPSAPLNFTAPLRNEGEKFMQLPEFLRGFLERIFLIKGVTQVLFRTPHEVVIGVALLIPNETILRKLREQVLEGVGIDFEPLPVPERPGEVDM